MERLAYGDAQLPIKNAVVQFFAAAACILTGHSVGREGPSIHIGAACGSRMGQYLRLPNSSIRLLVGCGAAAGIAAAFNTPLAGVIFTMEVIMVEYTITGFTPIILAAVSATAVSRSVFGAVPAFGIPDSWLGSPLDLAYIVFMGVVIGGLSTLLVRLLAMISKLGGDHPLWLRMTLAGFFTGLLALVAPDIMGSGYDTMDAALAGELGLTLLLTVLACKLLATALALGSGVPGGIIGPTLLIGALAGAALGQIFDASFPIHETSPTFFTMLGMGAMMGATLNAPLAALTALLELTGNPHIIMPGMLIVVTASLVNRQLFKTPSVFLKIMRAQGITYNNDPVTQLLRRLGVSRAMQRKVLEVSEQMERRSLEAKLVSPPTWLLIRGVDARLRIVFAADVVRYLDENPDMERFDLGEIPANRLEVAPISVQSTLLGALQKMESEQLTALYVIPPFGGDILGVITRQDIERSYRYTSG
jgi:H+/Cl- antiporter ClcA/CBS domain-containing protein